MKANSRFRRPQAGSVMIEYVVIALAFASFLVVADIAKDKIAEHQDEYTHSMAQPY